MGAREARHVAAYLSGKALDYARDGKYGRSWVLLREARGYIADMKDRVASRLAKRTEFLFVRVRDMRRYRMALAELAEYLA